MKRFAGIFMVLALTGVFACGDDTPSNGDEGVVFDNGGGDVKTDADVIADVKLDTPKNDTAGEVGTDDVITPNEGTNDGTIGETTDPDTINDETPIPVDVTEVGPDAQTDVPPACIDDEKTCKAANMCIGDCPRSGGAADPACVQQCEDQMSASGLEDYVNFNNCMETSCSKVTTQEELNACLNDKCLDTYFGCFWGCDYTSCLDLNGCLGACPSDNPATATINERQECVNGCYDGGTTEALIAREAGPVCALAACSSCDNPQTPAEEEACNDCFYAAAADSCESKFAPCASHETCVDFTECMILCPDDNPGTPNVNEGRQCSGACFQQTMPLGQIQRIEAEECNLAACPICEKENPTAAENEQCNTCWGDASAGSCAAKWEPCSKYATCGDMTECFGACPNDANRQTCMQLCFQLSSGVAQGARIDAEECTIGECPVCEIENPTPTQSTECDTCWGNSVSGATCGPKWNLCLSFGTKKCGETWTCVGNCADAACGTACRDEMTQTATGLWNAMIECAIADCTEECPDPLPPAQEEACNTCFNSALTAEGACATQFNACTNDAAAQ